MADPFHPPQGNWPLVPSPEPGVFVTRWEMVLTEAEVRRLAVHLDGGDRLEITAGAVAARLDDGRRWRIGLSGHRQRRIALLALPVCDVEVRLDGFDEVEAEAFLRRFHSVFRKGGG